MSELKPCPWCGKEPKTTLGRATNVVSIYCGCPMKPCVSIAVDYAIINNRQQPPTTEQLNFAESKAEYIWNTRADGVVTIHLEGALTEDKLSEIFESLRDKMIEPPRE